MTIRPQSHYYGRKPSVAAAPGLLLWALMMLPVAAFAATERGFLGAIWASTSTIEAVLASTPSDADGPAKPTADDAPATPETKPSASPRTQPSTPASGRPASSPARSSGGDTDGVIRNA